MEEGGIKVKIAYNKRSDVLYLTFSDTVNKCKYTESPAGIISRIDVITGNVVGVTVTNFLLNIDSTERMVLPISGAMVKEIINA